MRIILISLMFVYCSIVAFPEKVADLPELNKPHAIECDGENFYIVDDTTAHIYSMKGCKHIGSFGQRGEGPYELMHHPAFCTRLLLLNDRILFSSNHKMVVYTKKGKPIDEIIFHQFFNELMPFKKNYVTVQLDTDEKTQLTHIYKVILISPDFKNKRALITFVSPPTGHPNHGQGFTLPLYTFINVVNDNLYVFSMQHDNEIIVFNQEGKEIKRIKVNLPRLNVTESLKRDVIDYLKNIRYYKLMKVNEDELEKRVFFREDLPCFRLFKIRNGIIYLQTYVKKGNDYQFVLMDLNGKILKTLFLPINVYDFSKIGLQTTFCFDKNTYYYLVDNDETENWELHKIALDKIK
ncbi:MAG: hypothetical protein ACM3SY_14640 [Candidatus Omnitrophota bacterium]